jgi:hypothetical protein
MYMQKQNIQAWSFLTKQFRYFVIASQNYYVPF